MFPPIVRHPQNEFEDFKTTFAALDNPSLGENTLLDLERPGVLTPPLWNISAGEAFAIISHHHIKCYQHKRSAPPLMFCGCHSELFPGKWLYCCPLQYFQRGGPGVSAEE